MDLGAIAACWKGLALREVKTPEAADFILNTGIDRDEETLADYEDLLARGARNGVPMVCANADREALRGEVRVICAGALSQRYEALGGKVRAFGKPDPAMFESALRLLGISKRTRALTVGDSLATDIRGSERAGIDAVLVTGGFACRRAWPRWAPGRTANTRSPGRPAHP